MIKYFEDCKEKSDFARLISALRDALPEKDYPHKADYTAKEILSLYEPCSDNDADEVEEYGDEQCVCGHNIKYVYFVVLRSDPTITVEPVGSKCIECFASALFDGACLQKILDNFSLKTLWSGYYTTGDFTAKAGFTKDTLAYLSRYLDDYQYKFLVRIVRMRSEVYLTMPQIRLMYGIIKRIQEMYNDIVNDSKPALY